jgi:DNA adenine methylase
LAGSQQENLLSQLLVQIERWEKKKGMIMCPMSNEAPFPYFGGKSKVADRIWAALGQPAHYMEPFFGSGAVLLARPDYDPELHTETVCDADGFICNVWRAITFAPDEAAKWCDWPVNHADLSARRLRLLAEQARLLESLIKDDTYYDAKLAGYWVWAACCWIGRGLTGLTGLTRIGGRPSLGNKGMGVHKVSLSNIPHLADKGMGVHKVSLSNIPHLANKGRGVHKVSLGQGIPADELSAPYCPGIYTWFRSLSERLRRVRVVCGDWSRICGGNWQDRMGTVGIFFDPPYGVEDRDKELYAVDSLEIAPAVRAWCLERGNRPSHRIVLAGYYEEHEELLKHNWTVQKWATSGGYAHQGGKDCRGKRNRFREALFFSPHCITKKVSAALF